MRLFHAIWNGPFYIGKLSRPLSLGDVAMKVLETGWRTALVAGLTFVAAVLAIAVQARLPAPKALADQIVGTASFLTGKCKGDKPLEVQLKNTSNKNVGSIEFGVEIYRKGFSTNLADNELSSSDIIVQPGETAVNCLAPNFDGVPVGTNVSELNARVVIRHASETDLAPTATSKPKPG